MDYVSKTLIPRSECVTGKGKEEWGREKNRTVRSQSQNGMGKHIIISSPSGRVRRRWRESFTKVKTTKIMILGRALIVDLDEVGYQCCIAPC